ncbi:glutathione S-transferase family protein [Aquamicrobium sp. NLF2-7]|uniref:glutathione S-transferase family protein n=1 Tax=Aquamicrobium sp. NLF2-7 TaxID=2918753 RepID=UPI001EFB3428|nr:glutathione S-transferase family protein [Aquamicrobium sp. NLF2-7]MCG8269955.1 glutathione S-transferase family protein [Aquamicrobium sp. NLF2-7]
MALELYAHPFSSFCQKSLIALYENGTAFDYVMLSPENPSAMERLQSLWPVAKFPMLMDEGKPIHEATIIIEHLQAFHPGPVRLIPEDPKLAVDVRFMDRFFDNYISTPQQKLVFDVLRAPSERDPKGVEDAKSMLEKAYGWLDGHMVGREWAAGDGFSLADCAAAPALFYADWSHPIPDQFANVRAYRQRLNDRPSFARAINEARPYRAFFPLGAPDRD